MYSIILRLRGVVTIFADQSTVWSEIANILYLTGKIGVCKLQDLKVSRFKIDKPDVAHIAAISYDGCYLAVTDNDARNVIYVIDLVKKTM